MPVFPYKYDTRMCYVETNQMTLSNNIAVILLVSQKKLVRKKAYRTCLIPVAR